jgi:diaminopimelate dehydrogenase
MKIGILGYGNLGRSLACELQKTDHELVGIFSRRAVTDERYKVKRRGKLLDYKDEIDTLLIATSSLSDVEADTAEFLPYFNTVDSFDIHKKISAYKAKANALAKDLGRVAIISAGWDPGLLSVARAMAKISVGAENINTFWGIGKSLGHTTALKKVEGVRCAVQYTVPKEKSITLAKNTDAKLTSEDCHVRECFIVPESNADREKIGKTIKNMDGYFKGYDTVVNFISESEFMLKHSKNSHRGEVISTKISGGEITQFDMKIKIPSNSDFTAKIMISYLNAINYLQNNGFYGAFTPLEIPMSLLISEKTQNLLI